MSMMVMYNIGDFYLFPTYPLEVEKICTYLRKKGEKVRGIMLKERYIPGVFFLENGMQAATPRMKRLGRVLCCRLEER